MSILTTNSRKFDAVTWKTLTIAFHQTGKIFVFVSAGFLPRSQRNIENVIEQALKRLTKENSSKTICTVSNTETNDLLSEIGRHLCNEAGFTRVMATDTGGYQDDHEVTLFDTSQTDPASQRAASSGFFDTHCQASFLGVLGPAVGLVFAIEEDSA